MLKVAQKTKRVVKASSGVKYIRIPVDENTIFLLEEIKRENPFFSDVDSVRYILGKFAIQNNIQANRQKLMMNFEELKALHKNTPKYSEDEIFQILRDNDVM